MGTRKRLVSSSTSEPSSSSNPQQSNNPQQQSLDLPIASPKWGFLFKLSLFSIPYFYLIFYHFSIDSELRRSIIINAGLSLAGFFVTVRMIPVASRYVLRRNLFGYDINKKGTPLGNVKVPESLGIVVAIVFLVVAILFQYFNFTADSNWLVEYNAALACVCFMTLLGFVDDVLDVPWRVKLVLPSIAALPLLMAYAGHTTIVIPKPLVPHIGIEILDLGWIYKLYMGLLAVFCTNSINIHAGLNGLEVGQTVVITYAILIHNIMQIGASKDPEYKLAHAFSIYLVQPLLATSLALLSYNWYPSSVFVGDTYTYFAGMTMAVVGILGHFSETLLIFFLPQVLNFLLSPIIYIRISFHFMDSSNSTNITTIHPDIIQSHILTRLDGTALTSAASTTSHLHHLCTQNHLWHKITTATWPSLNEPLTTSLISTFPNSHRSIFSDSFPSVDYSSASTPSDSSSSSSLKELISAVDLYYKGKSVFSKVIKTETHKGWFLCSPLWIEILEPNEIIETPIKFEQNDVVEWLENNLSLSWIMISPTRKRSVNLSSRLPVTVRRHWLTGELEVLYAVVMGLVQCTIKVTCCGKAGGEMHVREVSLTMEDMDGRHLIGKDSLGILQEVMENGERKKVDVEKMKRGFEEFCLMKSERRERKLKRERVIDMVIMLIAIFIFAFLFRFVRLWVSSK